MAFFCLIISTSLVHSAQITPDSFYELCKSADNDMVYASIYKGGMKSKVNHILKYDQTPLMAAAFYNPDPEVLEVLIDAGARIDQQNLSGLSALHLAAQGNTNVQVIIRLLELGVDPDLVDMYGYTASHYALQNQADPAVIRALYEYGANFKKRLPDKTSIFMLACRYHPQWKVYNFVVGKGGDFNDRSTNGMTPLLMAAQGNTNLYILQSLIDNSGDINVKNDVQANALLLAAGSNPDPEALKMLIKAGIRKWDRDSLGKGAQHYAAIYNTSLAVHSYLSDLYKSLDDKDYDGNTPLILCAQHQYDRDVIEFYLNKGADISLKNRLGETVLHKAAVQRFVPDILDMILTRGADIDQQTTEGMTPLMLACRYNHNEALIRYFLKKGADKSLKDRSGKTAWDYAALNPTFRNSKVLKDLK